MLDGAPVAAAGAVDMEEDEDELDKEDDDESSKKDDQTGRQEVEPVPVVEALGFWTSCCGIRDGRIGWKKGCE